MPYFENQYDERVKELLELAGVPPKTSVVNSPYQNLARRAVDFLGLDNAKAQMEAFVAPAEIRGLFHGTSRRFPPTHRNPFGEFSDEFLGTGEGSQVFSYGHYTSEGKPVAKTYMDEPSPSSSFRQYYNRWDQIMNDPTGRRIFDDVSNSIKTSTGYRPDDISILQELSDRLVKGGQRFDDIPEELWNEIMKNRGMFMVELPKPTMYKTTAFKGRENPPILKWYEYQDQRAKDVLPEELKHLRGGDIWHELLRYNEGDKVKSRDALKEFGVGAMEYPSGTIRRGQYKVPYKNYVIYDPYDLWIEGIEKGK